MTGNVDRLIEWALEEDLGSPGDLTTQALISRDAMGVADVLVKEPLVLAGREVFERVFERLDPTMKVEWLCAEGESCPTRTVVGRVRGSMRTILIGERTALNFLQRLSGIASFSRQASEALQGFSCRLLDTRKTTPGWRALEKGAVRTGGAVNHRFGLFDGILIKDNHIAAVGSIGEAVRRARAAAHHLLRVEVEVVDLVGVDQALLAGADVILLDNMGLEQMRQAVERIGGRARTEASGGMTFDRLREVAATGVDFISMGALTHSARARDISLEVH